MKRATQKTKEHEADRARDKLAMQVDQLARLGLAPDQIAVVLDVRNQEQWFLDACRQGHLWGLINAAKKLQTLINEKNIAAITFYLKKYWQPQQSQKARPREPRAQLAERVRARIGKTKLTVVGKK